MRVLLVGPDLEENLSLRYLSSALKVAGHETRIAAFDKAEDLERARAAAGDADLVGLSMCYQTRAPEFLALARALKADRPERPVIAGGHYASCAAQALLANHPELDLVVVHEGEQTIVELAALPALSAGALGDVRGIVFRGSEGVVATPPREKLLDLDQLPWPDRSGPARLVVGVPTSYMMGSRGCLATCDYCCITTLHRLAPGKRFRQRRPEAVAEEMAWNYHERGVRQFIFHDDNFLVPSVEKNMERIDALDRELRRRGVRHIGLVLKCRPADVDRQVFLRLREMGLLRVFLGIESGTAAGLRSLGRKQSVEEAHRALRVCEELGISTQYTIIIFHPEATAETMRADLAFARDHLAHPLSFCRAEVYSGTPLEQRMIDAGRATGDYRFREYGYSDPATEVMWYHARRVLRARCWSGDNLMGRSIQLDHLTSVFRQFYDGREVDRLATEFQEWQLAVNRDTIALFEELFAVCEKNPRLDSPELQRDIARLRAKEIERRKDFEARACAFRERLHELSHTMVGLPVARPAVAVASPRPAPQTSILGRGPRHAAAVLLAVGMMGCGDDGSTYVDDSGVVEAPPMDTMPYDTWKDDLGVVEAPPMDTMPWDTKLDDAADVGDALDAPEAGDGSADGDAADAPKDGSDGGG